jgi:hypothetical protein
VVLDHYAPQGISIMVQKNRLQSYLYGPRAALRVPWFATTTGYSPGQDA